MKKSIMLILSTLIVIAAASSSCGTIIKGSRQNTAISSYPAHATVFIDNQNMGETPLTVKLERKDNHLVKIRLDGYQTYETKISHKFNYWIFGNLVFGGVIGIVVDAVDGAMYSLTPKQLDAQLKSGTAMIGKENGGLVLAVVLKSDPRWQKIGQLQRVN